MLNSWTKITSIVVSTLMVAGILFGCASWKGSVDTKLDQMNKQQTAYEETILRLNTNLDLINRQLSDVNSRLTRIETKMDDRK